MQILLQDKYNIGALTVNIEFMWLDAKRISKPCYINSIFTVNTPILYFNLLKICVLFLGLSQEKIHLSLHKFSVITHVADIVGENIPEVGNLYVKLEHNRLMKLFDKTS